MEIQICIEVHFSNYDVLLISIWAGAFLEAIENLGFDYIASGHYAHVVHPSAENTEAPYCRCFGPASPQPTSKFVLRVPNPG